MLVVGCVIAAQAVALQLVLKTPFIYDDSPNQAIKGYVELYHEGFWQFLRSLIEGQWYAIGRFTPLGLAENYGLHYVLHDRGVYKAFLVVITIVAVLCVARVCVSIGVPVAIALLGAALASLLFQLHLYHDPLTAYSGIVQVATILYSGSLLLFAAWLRRRGWWRLVASLLLVVAANLMYEAAYPLVVLHLALAIGTGHRLRTASGHLLVTLGFVALTLYGRSTQLDDGGQYSVGLDPEGILTALGRQLSAALPMANFLDPGGPKTLPDSGSLVPELRGVAIAALLVPVLIAAAHAAKRWEPQRRTWIALALVCLTLYVLPAGLVALAPRYQAELRWGVGYLPVFFGVVAVALAAAAILALIARRIPVAVFVTAATVVAAVVASINAEGSTRVVASLEPVAMARDELDEAMDRGVFDRTPLQTMLLFDRGQISPPVGPWLANYGFDLRAWIYTRTDRMPRALPMLPDAPLAQQCQDGAGGAQPCALVEGPFAWFTTGRLGQTRWILLTPTRTAPVGAKTDLYQARAGARARLAVRTTSAARLRALATSWRVAGGEQTMTAGFTAAGAQRRGSWTFVDIGVPRRAAASSGVLADRPTAKEG